MKKLRNKSLVKQLVQKANKKSEIKKQMPRSQRRCQEETLHRHHCQMKVLHSYNKKYPSPWLRKKCHKEAIKDKKRERIQGLAQKEAVRGS